MGHADNRLKPREQLRLGPLLIEPATRRLQHEDGREMFLEPKVIQVLAALAQAEGAILSRDDLVNICWGGRAIGDEAVFRAISRLRQTTEGIAAGVFRIETIPKAGYRLIGEASSPATQETPSPVPAPGEGISRRGLVLGAATLGVVGTGLAVAWQARLPTAKPARLAVLPFRPRDRTPAYLAEGLARELVDEAGRMAGLEVVGAASSFGLPATQQAPAAAADALGATLVLVGEVAETPDALSVTARLLPAPQGEPLWTEELSGPPSELFRLRNALLSRVAETAGASGRPMAWHPVDPEALRMYLDAQARWRPAGARVTAEIEALLDDAAARDPGFAHAWSQLGAARLSSAYRSWIVAPRGTVFDRDRLTAALAAAGRASGLRPDFATPFVTTASAMGYLGAWAEAHRAAQAAIGRGGAPSALLLKLGQRRDAISVARKWVRLDPMNGPAQFALGQSLRLVGDHPAAVAAMREAFRLNPTPDSWYDLMVALTSAGEVAEARRHLDADPDLLAAAHVQYAPMTRDWFLYLMGDAPPPDPDRILARMDRGDGFHEMAAIMFARIGALRQGGMMLDRMGAYEIPVIHMIFGEECAPLRQLPAFGQLMQRIGLAAYWREGDHWPDFRFTLDEQVGRGAATKSAGR